MSFTQSVKEEMLNNSPISTYQTKYELETFFKHCVSFSENNIIKYKSENKIATERFIDDIFEMYGISLHSLFDFNSDEKTVYEFELENEDIFNDALNANRPNYDSDNLSLEHKKIYIKITFLILGCILDPNKNYHIEFAFQDNMHANILSSMLESFNIYPKTLVRKNLIILYIKDSSQISTFLSILNAYSAVLEIENIKIYKDVRNSINRSVNCETANLKKTINASLKQIEAIELINKIKGLNYLPPQLFDVAEARLNNRDMNLQELADMLNISKSCINHRFRKIIEIADEIR